MLIPFDRGDVINYLNEHASITSTNYEEEGTLLQVELKQADYKRYEKYVYKQ